jgi:hypothetical protein
MTDTLYNMKKGYEKDKQTVTEFIDPDGGDKVNSGIGFPSVSSPPGYRAGGLVRQPYAGVNFIAQSGIHELGYWTYWLWKRGGGGGGGGGSEPIKTL